MIITPQELLKRQSDFTVIDVRPDHQRDEFPINGLNAIVTENGSIPKVDGEKVLVCQFGIVTEGMIIEKDLHDTFSLLGGAQAWDKYYKEQIDFSRWSRQTVLPEIGIDGQKKMADANVAIVGMGGLGCPVAQSLLIAGIGTLKLIDGDHVSLSNLHRQPLFCPNDIDKPKVEIAKNRLSHLNPDTSIIIVNEFLNEENGDSLFSNVDVIIDATDNIKTRQIIDYFSKRENIPMVYGGLFRFEGQVSVLNVNGSPGFLELFPEPPTGGNTCEDAGVLSMLPGIIGNIQALEAVKLIIGIEPNLIGKLLIYDGMNHSTDIINIA